MKTPGLLDFERGFDKWVEIWEHEFNTNLNTYKDLLDEETLHNMVEIFNARDSVTGRRIEVFRMYCSVDNPGTQSIMYLDVNSLYPYVMSEISFSIGHPEIIECINFRRSTILSYESLLPYCNTAE